MIRLVFAFILALLSLGSTAQNATVDSLSQLIGSAKEDTNKVILLIELGTKVKTTDPEKTIECCEKALKLSKLLGYNHGIANAQKLIGLEYYYQGKYADALIHWQDAEAAYQNASDTIGIANILSNMGAIYHNQSEYSKALDLYLKSLALAEKIRDTLRIGTVLQNIGAIHVEKGDNDLAMEAYQKAIQLFNGIGYTEGMGIAQLNIGELYSSQQKYRQAIIHLEEAMTNLKGTPHYSNLLRTIGTALLYASKFNDAMMYLDSAYHVADKSGDQFELTRVINTKAQAYEIMGEDDKALALFEKAKSIMLDAERDNLEMIISAKGLVRIYSKKRNYERAFENQLLLQSVNDSIFSLESDKKIDQLLFNFELEKKEDKIALLVKDTEIKNIELDRQKSIRNGFIAGFILVLVFALVFFQQRNRISKEKQRSEHLLLNILPEEVAEELKEKGSAEAKLIDHVTVLFTDFEGFTAISEHLSPKDLVNDLNICFSEFDRIVGEHHLEKIKTIGDAYMAAGGLPTPNDTHASDVVKAAFKMRDFVEAVKARKIEAGLPYFEIRIGIHTGPVVAGIVGVKKFQYDIWGDTVNTASRMESAGEVGKVNVSQATYKLLKDDADLAFENRGKIYAKGKGEINMYFVTRKTDHLGAT
jgi:class 3 adenylate cyclase/Tfp pilus assembly protein PilF